MTLTKPLLFILFIITNSGLLAQLKVDPFLKLITIDRLFVPEKMEKHGYEKDREHSRKEEDVYRHFNGDSFVIFSYLSGNRCFSISIQENTPNNYNEIIKYFNLKHIDHYVHPELEKSKAWLYCEHNDLKKKAYLESVKDCDFELILPELQKNDVTSTVYRILYFKKLQKSSSIKIEDFDPPTQFYFLLYLLNKKREIVDMHCNRVGLEKRNYKKIGERIYFYKWKNGVDLCVTFENQENSYNVQLGNTFDSKAEFIKPFVKFLENNAVKIPFEKDDGVKLKGEYELTVDNIVYQIKINGSTVVTNGIRSEPKYSLQIVLKK